ncbi:hypothetical protein DL96DRAFT_1612681 [Flagelloscypha sp. PMI_526]|nr:hypothetical protein DL96DRAFT_1612681 [Flagelloscypha sp. PMI_526]
MTTSFQIDRSLLNPKFESYRLEIIDEKDVLSRLPLPSFISQASTESSVLLSFVEVRSRISHNHLYAEKRLYEVTVGRVPNSKSSYHLPSASTSGNTSPPEYPSIAPLLGGKFLIVSDGSPLKFHAAIPTDDSLKADVIISSRLPSKAPDISFQVCKVSVFLTSQDVITPLSSTWCLKGTDTPLMVQPTPSTWLVLGGSSYVPLHTTDSMEYKPSMDELAPIPRAGEIIGTLNDERPSPYSWTQTDESITLAFALPSTITKQDISVSFSPTTLDLQVRRPSDASRELLWPSYRSHAWWDRIIPTDSYWTWDPSDSPQSSFGILTLYIEKSTSPNVIKWQHVFASAANENEVPETIDPSELYNIRESLEKWTKSLQIDGGRGGMGLGEVSSLADGNSGREVYVTFDPFRKRELRRRTAKRPVLSSHFPTSWKHSHTFPALSFVLASKTDARFVYHIPGRAVLLFDSGVAGRGANMYLYRACGKGDIWGKQAILKVGEGGGGALLGVGMLEGGALSCLFEKELVVINGISW